MLLVDEEINSEIQWICFVKQVKIRYMFYLLVIFCGRFLSKSTVPFKITATYLRKLWDVNLSVVDPALKTRNSETGMHTLQRWSYPPTPATLVLQDASNTSCATVWAKLLEQPALCGIPLWESYNHRLSPDHGIILSLFFGVFFMFFPVSYHSPIMWNCHFHVFSFSNHVQVSFS